MRKIQMQNFALSYADHSFTPHGQLYVQDQQM